MMVGSQAVKLKQHAAEGGLYIEVAVVIICR